MSELTPSNRNNTPANIKIEKTILLVKAILQKNVSITQKEMNLTLRDTFNKPILKEVFKGENQQIGFLVVKKLVDRFCDSFGFSTKKTEDQLEIMTIDVLESFSHESMEDVILFLRDARKGSFGSTNRGVDSNLLIGEYFPKYLEKKSLEREKLYKQRKTEREKGEALTADEVKNLYLKKRKEKLKNNPREYIEALVKNFDRQMLEDLITDWNRNQETAPFVKFLKEQRKNILK